MQTKTAELHSPAVSTKINKKKENIYIISQSKKFQ
jgi:hypothetical protein